MRGHVLSHDEDHSACWGLHVASGPAQLMALPHASICAVWSLGCRVEGNSQTEGDAVTKLQAGTLAPGSAYERALLTLMALPYTITWRTAYLRVMW